MRISFIVTIREHAHTLGDCLQSVLAASRPGDEVILIDEHSSDSAREVIALAPRKLPHDHPLYGKIAVLGPKKRKGAGRPDALNWRAIRLGARSSGGRAVAANTGLSIATAEAVIVLDGTNKLDPAGIDAARAEMIETGADVILGRFAGAFCDDEHHLWTGPDSQPDACQRMESQPARMLLQRNFLLARGLRFDEGPFILEEHLFHWRVCLRARNIRLLDRVLSYAPAFAEEGRQNAEALSVVFAHHRRISEMLAPDGPHAALRDWLARMVGRHLAALSPMDYWSYAAAADPAALDGEWPEGRGGRALAALSTRPLWQAVALWQSEAIWAEVAERFASDSADQEPRERPQRQAERRAIALWRGMRSGSSACFRSSDNSCA